MKCQFCGKQLADDAVFCTACGKKQEQEKKVKMVTPLFCTNCGEKLKAGAGFCTKCGTKVEAVASTEIDSVFVAPVAESAQQDNKPQQMSLPRQVNESHNTNSQKQENKPVQRENKTQSKESSGSGKKVLIIIIICIFFLLLCALGFMFLYNNVLNSEDDRIEKDYDDDEDEDEDDDKKDKKSSDSDADKKDDTDKEKSDKDSKDDKSDEDEVEADYDLSDHPDVTLEGTFSESNSGDYVIKLPQNLSFKDGDVFLDEVKSIRINMSDLDYKINDHASKGDYIKITGQGYTEDGKVYIKAKTVVDSEGKDITESGGLDGDYIIENSSRELLTDDDIKDLSLQELNYAKNEIYARHGRKFASKELQDYFGSKDWYNGTIEPEDFSDYMLNDVELANAKLLKDREYSLDPNGYPLDK